MLVRILNGDKWSHLGENFHIWSAPAGIQTLLTRAKAQERYAMLPDRFSVGYIWLGTRLVLHMQLWPVLRHKETLIVSTNSLSAHRHFSMKLMLITAQRSMTTQHLHSFKFTLVNKSHSQHSEAAVCCLRRHFLILYACAHQVSVPDQRPRSMVWKQD